MTCPHCHHQFPLTWSRYFRSPGGAHTCPQCGKRSQLKLTLSYLLVTFIAWLVFAAAAVAILIFFLHKPWREVLTWRRAVAVLILGCVVMLPVDKFYDERFRRLEKTGKS